MVTILVNETYSSSSNPLRSSISAVRLRKAHEIIRPWIHFSSRVHPIRLPFHLLYYRSTSSWDNNVASI